MLRLAVTEAECCNLFDFFHLVYNLSQERYCSRFLILFACTIQLGDELRFSIGDQHVPFGASPQVSLLRFPL